MKISFCFQWPGSIKKIIEFHPAIVISDIKTKEHDGLWMLEMLKQCGVICSIIMLSGYDDYYLKELSDNDDYVIQKAKEYISKNYFNNITLQDVAEQLFLHPNYFSTLFSSKTNTNFRDYLRSVRIDNAKALMQHSDIRIADVAIMVGYNDISHFIRAFKRATSMTPSAYRKQQKKE